MKTLGIKLIAMSALLLAAFSASAQSYLEDPRYGATPAEREQNVLNLNLFRDAYNNKDYDTALGFLRPLLKTAPKASENLYIMGSAIYKTKIIRATSMAQKRAYVDTLMMIYDLRADNFAEHVERGLPYIRANQAREYLTYNATDREKIREYFLKAIEVSGNNVDPDVVNIYYQELINDYKNDHISADMVLNEYDRLVVVFDRDPEALAEAKKTFEQQFMTSGVANCDNIEKIFKPRLAANPNDTTLFEKCIILLQRANCNNDFQIEIAEKYYALKPLSNTALALAAGFEERKEYDKALHYLNEAVATEHDPAMKSNLYVRIAASYLGKNSSAAAASAARSAIDANPDNGYAYMFLGQAYAVGASACSGFDRQSVFWLVYDTLIKARSMITEEKLQQSIDHQLGSYRASFPSKEECFFRGLNNGDGITVNCGSVSGRTTVRER